jgi:hypothetical protein
MYLVSFFLGYLTMLYQFQRLIIVYLVSFFLGYLTMLYQFQRLIIVENERMGKEVSSGSLGHCPDIPYMN